jgi:hypothetical protein
MSEGPPGGQGTTMVMVCDGNEFALAAPLETAIAMPAAARKGCHFIFIIGLLWFFVSLLKYSEFLVSGFYHGVEFGEV